MQNKLGIAISMERIAIPDSEDAQIACRLSDEFPAFFDDDASVSVVNTLALQVVGVGC